jgi:hypothetical protein
MEHAKPNNLPVLLGVGAIALAALAAGLAAGPYLRGAPAGPVLPTEATGPVEPAAGGGGEGLTLPSGAEGAGVPEGAGGAAEAGAGEGPLSEDERLGDLLSDIITQFGELRRRVEALENAKGGGANGGGEGVTRLDPKTGQEYRAVTVWVPEGLEDEAAELLRESVLDALFQRNDWNAEGMRPWMLLKDTAAPQQALEQWNRVLRDFGAAWSGRDVAEIRRFAAMIEKHVGPLLEAAAKHHAAAGRPEAWSWPGPESPPAPSHELRPTWDRMVAGLRPEWRAFVDELPFDVKARYLSWCSPFLKGD